MRYANMNVDAMWTPDESQLSEFEAAFRRYIENIAVDGEREFVLAHLRRLHREYAGFIHEGKKYIVCYLHEGNLDDKPPDNQFTSPVGEFWRITHIIFDVESSAIVQWRPPGY